MIELTKITGEKFYLNPDVLKFVEDCGDTILTLTTGERLLVREEVEEIVSQFLCYKRKLSSTSPFSPVLTSTE